MGVATETRGTEGVTFRVGASEYVATRRLWSMMGGPEPPPEFASNGCGPKLGGTLIGRLLSWVVPDRVDCWSLLIPCHWHDHFYAVGGGWRDRRAADWNLARNIVTVIAEHGGSMSAIRIFAIGLAYWVAVRLGGWCAWTYRDGVVPATATRRAVTAAVTGPGVAIRLAGHALATSRPIAWVQARLEELNARQEEIEERIRAEEAARAEAEAERTRPRPPRQRSIKTPTERPRLRLVVAWGVDRYLDENGRDTGAHALRGCKNDVDHQPSGSAVSDASGWCQVMAARGWTIAACLLDADATKEKIFHALRAATERLEPGDALAIFGSSHGTLNDDPRYHDGQEECLVPYDGILDWPLNLGTHDEFEDVLASASLGSTILFFADACHTGERSLRPSDSTPRFLEHWATPDETNITSSFTSPRAVDVDAAGPVLATAWRGVALWSGCGKHQTSADVMVGGFGRGAASMMAKRALLSEPRPATLRQLHDAQTRLLIAAGYDQRPQLVGDPAVLDSVVL